MKNKFFYILFIFLFMFCNVAFAYERIISFDSLIQAQYDGALIVTEKISVYHEGDKIRRGIYRDLPTKNGEVYELLDVQRNGYPEPSFVEKRRGYYRINTGNDNYLQHPGVSVYTIKYKVFNVPQSYDGYDEIYWNVTGGEWAFPIEKAQVKVELPSEVSIIQQASYVGKKGSRNSASYLGNGEYYTDNLNPGEQLTIAVGFTPQIIKTSNHFSTNCDFKIMLLPYFCYLFFLIYIWHKKGRDPIQKTIMPQYEPPKELTAAQAACLFDKGVKKDIFLISFIQMISSGFLKLTTKKEKNLRFSEQIYIFNRTDKKPENCEEADIYWHELILDNKKNANLIKDQNIFEHNTKKRMKPFYTTNNIWCEIPTIIMFYLIACCNHLFTNAIIFFSFSLLFVIFTVLVCRLCRSLVFQIIYVSFICGLMLPFIYVINPLMSFTTLCFIALIGITAAIFTFLLYQPSTEGQRLTEYLKGLYMFLKATKEPVSKGMKLEQILTEESMERLFPYAMALGLKKEWEIKFQQVFGIARYQNFIISHPYMGPHFSRTFSNCTPSSSGGSGGCGGAGGGCGGGGGGGR